MTEELLPSRFQCTTLAVRLLSHKNADQDCNSFFTPLLLGGVLQRWFRGPHVLGKINSWNAEPVLVSHVLVDFRSIDVARDYTAKERSLTSSWESVLQN